MSVNGRYIALFHCVPTHNSIKLSTCTMLFAYFAITLSVNKRALNSILFVNHLSHLYF